MLSDSGYDVWLGNNRGNFLSQNHINLTIDQKQFWNFDFEDMGLYDIPAFIDFILKKTDGKNINGKVAAYVGHSEGTT